MKMKTTVGIAGTPRRTCNTYVVTVPETRLYSTDHPNIESGDIISKGAYEIKAYSEQEAVDKLVMAMLNIIDFEVEKIRSGV